MKKLSFFANTLQRGVLCLVLLMSTCMVGFTSCSDDDEEDNTSTDIVGTWQSVNIDSWEEVDGERSEFKGPYTKMTFIFTADGKLTIKDDGETDSGTYKLAGDKLTVKSEGGIGEMKVLALNGDKLIIELEGSEIIEDGMTYKEYMKIEFRRVKK